MPLAKNNMFFGFTQRMDLLQQAYVDSLFDYQLTIVNAPAGTGKTTLAVAAAKLSGMKLEYIFSPVEENALGYRPGTTFEKINDYLSPLHSALIEIGENPSMVIYNEDMARDPKAGRDMVKSAKSGSAWVFPKPHSFARGSNISNRFVILDECQNYTKNELKKILTRLHDSCRVAMIGHCGQVDLRNPSTSGFAEYIEFFRGKSYANVCELTTNYRGILATDADKA